jgi:hypothetical protein
MSTPPCCRRQAVSYAKPNRILRGAALVRCAIDTLSWMELLVVFHTDSGSILLYRR